MRQKLAVPIITAVIFVTLGAVVLAITVDNTAPSPPRPSSAQWPSPGPPLFSDGTHEAEAVLEQIKWALVHQGCQLGIEVRLNGAGQLEPRIRVELVHRLIVTPFDDSKQ
jgi:hypothetical protein